jgi:hypothetical protein
MKECAATWVTLYFSLHAWVFYDNRACLSILSLEPPSVWLDLEEETPERADEVQREAAST